MSDVTEPSGATQWRAGHPRSQRATAPIDPEVAQKRADMRAALAADGQNAKAEYEAHRRGVGANTARLTALRLARDAAVVAVPKNVVAASTTKPPKGRGLKGVRTIGALA
jgi:hypothetical protein